MAHNDRHLGQEICGRETRHSCNSAAMDNSVEVWKSATCTRQAPRGEWPPPDGAPDRGRNARRNQAAGGHQLEACLLPHRRIDGYVIEGHVPAPDIKRLVSGHPDAIGLSVPGMPVGARGMEQGAESEAYDVLLIKKDGTTEVFARH
jgi:Protein of unknown function, DUF